MYVPPDAKPPWERWANESEAQWRAFQAYLTMPPGTRSVLGAYKIYSGRVDDPTAVAPSESFRRWSGEFNWQGRVIAWDNEVARQAAEAQVQERIKQAQMWERRRQELIEVEWQLALKMANRSNLMLDVPLMREVKSTEARDPQTGEVIRDSQGNPVKQTITIEPALWRVRDAERLAATASNLQRRAAQMASDLSEPALVTAGVNLVVNNAGQAQQPQPEQRPENRAPLPDATRLRLARLLVNSLMNDMPDKERDYIVRLASQTSGVPVALLNAAGSVIEVNKE